MKKTIDKFCRICGKAETQLIPIFSDDGLVHNLPVKIEKHLFSIQVTETDKLPQNMCYQCTSSLIIWNDLFELSIKTDQNFKNDLKKFQASNGSSVDFVDSNVSKAVSKKKSSDSIVKKLDTDEIDESITEEIFQEIRDFDHFLNQSPTSSVASDSDHDPLNDVSLESDPIPNENSMQNATPKISMKQKKPATGRVSKKSTPKRNSQINNLKNTKQSPIKVIAVDYSEIGPSETTNSAGAVNEEQQAEIIHEVVTESATIDNIDTADVEVLDSTSHTPNEENTDSPNDSIQQKKNRRSKNSDPSISNLESRVCHICGKFFKGADTMRIHVKTVHSTERPHVCSICNTAFKRKDHLDCHVKYKHGNNSYPKRPPKEGAGAAQKRLCVHCGKILSSSQVLKEHINSFHSGNRPYNCEQCNLSFSRYSTFYHHTVVRNHKISTFFKTCDICGLDFQSESFYFKHMWKHPENVFCEICNITFDDNDLFRKHIETSHEEEKSFQCSSCGKRFGSKNSLKLHLRVHTGEKPFECKYCSWRFHKKGQLVVHIYRHTGEKPYVCNVCGRGFKQKGDMRKHKAGHHMQLKKTGSSSS